MPPAKGASDRVQCPPVPGSQRTRLGQRGNTNGPPWDMDRHDPHPIGDPTAGYYTLASPTCQPGTRLTRSTARLAQQGIRRITKKTLNLPSGFPCISCWACTLPRRQRFLPDPDASPSKTRAAVSAATPPRIQRRLIYSPARKSPAADELLHQDLESDSQSFLEIHFPQVVLAQFGSRNKEKICLLPEWQGILMPCAWM